MVLVLLNILVLFGLIASNNFGQNLLNTVSASFSRISEDTHKGSDVTSGDHTMAQLVQEAGYHPPPKMGLKPTGSASPSIIGVKAVAIR